MKSPVWCAVAFILSAFVVRAESVVRVKTLQALRQAVAAARAGTRIEIEPGEYEGGFFARDLRGEATQPIIITGADPKRPPLLKGGAQLAEAAFVELSSLRLAGFAGNAVAIDDGGTTETPTHHIVLRNLQVSEIGPAGNFHGVKMAGVDDFLIAGCTFEHWGTGAGLGIDAVGCHRGVIEHCTLRHDAPPKPTGAVGIQVKGGCREIVIRHNRFENAGERALNIGGSTGLPYFRPALKDWPKGEPRYEASEITVEDNTIVGSEAAVAFVNVAGSVVRANTLVEPRRWALRILQESRGAEFAPSARGVFEGNLIVFHSDKWAEGGCNVGPGTDAASFRFARNAWFCADQPARSKPRLPSPESGGLYGQDPQLTGEYRIGAPDFPRGFGAKPE